MSDKQTFSDIQRVDLVIPCSEKGMEHVGFKWNPSSRIPVGQVYPLIKEVQAELEAQKVALIETQRVLGRPRKPSTYLPDVLEEVSQYHVKALREFGSQEERLSTLLTQLRNICPHRAAFPLDNPASAKEVVGCPDCRTNVRSGDVYDGNARGSVAQIHHAWAALTGRRPSGVVEAAQRQSRLDEAQSAMATILGTQSDAGVLATLNTVIATEMGVIQETLAASKKRLGAFELSVEAFIGAVLILKLTGERRTGPASYRLGETEIMSLIGEFAVSNSLFSQFTAAMVKRIDIWN